ncbi:hypothetical protein B0A49_11299, partial [Cryomyces minteri]
MQPQRVLELHVVYAPSRSRTDRNAPVKGGTQDIAQKKKSTQAAGDVFYQQLVRDVREQEFGRVSSFAFELESKSGETVTEPGLSDSQPSQIPWTLQFYDVPEPGKRTVVSRAYSITEITGGDAHRYVTKYMLEGQRLVYKNVVVLLHQILRFPTEHDTDEAMNTQLPTYTSLRPLDEAESYVLQASVRILDGSKPENLATGTEELLAFKELMKGAVDLSVVDRLSLDTRDSTLISPASGKKFGRDALDWKWWHSSVPGTIKSLARDGHLIVVMSSQGGISLRGDSKTLKMDQKRLSDFKGKVAAVLAQLDIPITVYAATGKDQYRKPRTGVWQQLIKDYEVESADSVDLENSVFVGDAAGRPGSMNNGAAKDHSCSDRLANCKGQNDQQLIRRRDFASNVGIDFKTPEEFFLGEQPKPFVRLFDPAKYLDKATTRLTDAAPLTFARSNPLDLVLFCGSPGAGKSTLYWQHLKPLGYERVNQDILKTRDRCMKNAIELISNGSPVVVDNTNADPDTRSQWINLAKRLDVPIRCILFTASPRLCEHNDTVRALNVTLMNPEKRTLLPKIAFAGFLSRYREPTLQEGFQDITKVDFK